MAENDIYSALVTVVIELIPSLGVWKQRAYYIILLA
jgi:hypothetical protein